MRQCVVHTVMMLIYIIMMLLFIIVRGKIHIMDWLFMLNLIVLLLMMIWRVIRVGVVTV